MSSIITGAWTPVTTDIETHLGLQFGVNITELIELSRDSGNYDYRNIAKADIAKGEDVDTRNAFDSYYEVDGERLVQIAKYSPKGKMQCYNGKYGLLNDSTVYYSAKGNLYVKDSSRTVKQSTTSSNTPKVDIFANLKRA